MISKELLSEVLGETVISVSEGVYSENKICYTLSKLGTNVFRDDNIHELAHKCKEWAWFNHPISGSNYLLPSTKEHDYDTNNRWVCHVNSQIRLRANTEPEAIFKACEWILNDTSTT